MKVALSARAELDLAAIGDWIARDNPARADGYVQELLDACAALADFPAAYRRLGRIRDRAVHQRAYGRYLIVYELGAAMVTVLSIVHGARDIDAMDF